MFYVIEICYVKYFIVESMNVCGQERTPKLWYCFVYAKYKIIFLQIMRYNIVEWWNPRILRTAYSFIFSLRTAYNLI